MDCRWEDAPAIEDCMLLGFFRTRRSHQDRYRSVDEAALLDFLKSDSDGVVTMLVFRDAPQEDGEGPGLIHAFTSDSHPQVQGPVLRLFTR